MVKIKGSKNGGIVTAHFDGKSKSLYPSLKNTKALVLLSITGNEFCAGEYLKAIVEKACLTHEFTTFLIADEVFWHNLRVDFSSREEEELRKQASELGQAYFEENLSSFLSPLGISPAQFDEQELKQFPLDKMICLNKLAKEKSNFEVVNWSSWLNKSKKFLLKQDEIQSFFFTEDTLMDSVEDTASNFARRHATETSTKDLLLKRSKGYLIEETPGVIWVAASLGYNFIIYPGEMIKPFKKAKDFFVKSQSKQNEIESLSIHSKKPELLVNWLEVSFKRTHNTSSKNNNINHLNNNINKPTNQIDGDLLAIMKGVTEGIFSQSMGNDEKIECLSKIILNISKQT
ncbi:hypothetical protein [Legionella yabuuchiae]|uniref:hypothetical protein n=1 Tax=Legionella yabuuchiae TaxID=376727 RepID=UPI00105663D5|nr:hypothetical protein [Legionella yabuuchiae]